ncbi:hypothetical protein Y696_08080 [Mesotoga sp. H07pep.5.4]|uniref:hypothetical protein n=1 Tax=unclassified Mesotoga TaxID=1184398 RepID=UPI000FED189B|nr:MULTISPECIES: hypothetical protein [unclassified Mesotoga]RLL87696.1 hypothetical protein Y696_08080 [Mesotoga sp. H07pep.5.4]
MAKRKWQIRVERLGLEAQLRERNKELELLHDFSRLVDIAEDSIDDILIGLLEILPDAFLEPENTCAVIVYNDRVYESSRVVKSDRFIREPIRVRGNDVGSLTVYYYGDGEIAFLYE